jgi:hypothetical protein
MTADEIIVAIKNALARGENIEKAKQSLINAGYSRADVEKAANQLLNLMRTGSAGIQPPFPTQHFQKTTQELPEKKIDKKRLILVVILLMVAVAIAVSLIMTFM